MNAKPKTMWWSVLVAFLMVAVTLPTTEASPTDEAEQLSGLVMETTGLNETSLPGTPTDAMSASFSPDPKQGSTILIGDGCTVQNSHDQIDWVEISSTLSSSVLHVRIRWLPADTGVFTQDDGVHLKAFHYDGTTWNEAYSKIYTPSQFTLDNWHVDEFDYTIPTTAADGTNYIRASIIDRAGSTDSMTGTCASGTSGTTTSGGSRHYDNADVSFTQSSGSDTTPPSITGVSSSSHSSSTTWYHKNTASFSWTATDIGGSGISHYSHHIGSGNPSCSDNDGSSASASYSIGGLSTGTQTFKVRAIDNAGNCGSVASYDFKVDATAPDITDREPSPGETVADARQMVRVEYHDDHSGIDTSSIQFFVDSVNKTSEAIITSSQLTYTPSVAWSSGSHDLEIWISDNAEGTANQVTSSWSFTYSPSSSGGGGGGSPGGGGGGSQCLVENRNMAIDGACADDVWRHSDVDRLFGQAQVNLELLACQVGQQTNLGCQDVWN